MDDAMPREVFVSGGKDVTDQAGRSRVDVAVGADESSRNRAHPGHDALRPRVGAAALHQRRPGRCCSNISRTSRTLVASSGFFSVRAESLRKKRNANPGWSPLMPAV